MASKQYYWPQCLAFAGLGGFAAWFISLISNYAINSVLPFRIPLWLTTILSLIGVTYWLAKIRAPESVRRRILLSVVYVVLVIVVAIAVKWFIATAFEDSKSLGIKADKTVYRYVPFWASLILTWVFLAHGELRDGFAREAEREIGV